MKNSPLQQHLINLLGMEGAHISFDDVVKDFPSADQGKKPAGAPHTPWQLLEHIRIAQADILEFSRNAKHKSPKWPEGYWPKSEAPPNDAAWDKSVSAFRHDLDEMKKLVVHATDEQLYAPILHGDGQTLLREALLVADHNSYHLGQLMFVKKMLESSK